MTQPFNLPSTHPAAESRLWIRNPLAAFTANSLDASGGLVVSGGRIVEVLGRRPVALRPLPADLRRRQPRRCCPA